MTQPLSHVSIWAARVEASCAKVADDRNRLVNYASLAVAGAVLHLLSGRRALGASRHSVRRLWPPRAEQTQRGRAVKSVCPLAPVNGYSSGR